MITSLVLAGCALVPLVVAGIELPRIAAEGGPRLWIEFAPQSYSPHYPDLALQAVWMLIAAQNRGLNVAMDQGPRMGPWMAQHHVVWLMGYQPPDRFWALQAIVGGGLLTVSGLLAAATIWLVRRRPA